MSKKTLVTGGGGFIGPHLVNRLLNEGHEAIVLDNFSNGRMENLSGHINNEKLQIKKVDIADYDRIHMYFKGTSWVFHLAALADIVPSIQNPPKYHRSNVDGTINVLEASRKNNVQTRKNIPSTYRIDNPSKELYDEFKKIKKYVLDYSEKENIE